MADEQELLTDTMRHTIAVHELGHAVAMREAGLTPGVLTVTEGWFSGAVNGFCRVKEKWFPTVGGEVDWDIVKGYLAGCMAGQAAVDHLQSLRGEPRLFTAADDYAEYESDSAGVPGGYPIGLAEAAARVIVVDFWEEIERLAPELAETGRLSTARLR
jgi:hypothetical protein